MLEWALSWTSVAHFTYTVARDAVIPTRCESVWPSLPAAADVCERVLEISREAGSITIAACCPIVGVTDGDVYEEECNGVEVQPLARNGVFTGPQRANAWIVTMRGQPRGIAEIFGVAEVHGVPGAAGSYWRVADPPSDSFDRLATAAELTYSTQDRDDGVKVARSPLLNGVTELEDLVKKGSDEDEWLARKCPGLAGGASGDLRLLGHFQNSAKKRAPTLQRAMEIATPKASADWPRPGPKATRVFLASVFENGGELQVWLNAFMRKSGGLCGIAHDQVDPANLDFAEQAVRGVHEIQETIGRNPKHLVFSGPDIGTIGSSNEIRGARRRGCTQRLSGDQQEKAKATEARRKRRGGQAAERRRTADRDPLPKANGEAMAFPAGWQAGHGRRLAGGAQPECPGCVDAVFDPRRGRLVWDFARVDAMSAAAGRSRDFAASFGPFAQGTAAPTPAVDWPPLEEAAFSPDPGKHLARWPPGIDAWDEGHPAFRTRLIVDTLAPDCHRRPPPMAKRGGAGAPAQLNGWQDQGGLAALGQGRGPLAGVPALSAQVGDVEGACCDFSVESMAEWFGLDAGFALHEEGGDEMLVESAGIAMDRRRRGIRRKGGRAGLPHLGKHLSFLKLRWVTGVAVRVVLGRCILYLALLGASDAGLRAAAPFDFQEGPDFDPAKRRSQGAVAKWIQTGRIWHLHIWGHLYTLAPGKRAFEKTLGPAPSARTPNRRAYAEGIDRSSLSLAAAGLPMAREALERRVEQLHLGGQPRSAARPAMRGHAWRRPEILRKDWRFYVRSRAALAERRDLEPGGARDLCHRELAC
ncbi:unnamed protein product [Prorocentrum cordatum]|uniref:Uncharacterized protein n=1 Tax=Prorocentrum cordatum TaxID=2364126 RepID=A0ABN9U8V0_9DINO|nr:unnamed protein product [Polarella glacialis]